MFATLIIQLPSEFTGGGVTCQSSNGNQEVTIDLGSSERSASLDARPVPVVDCGAIPKFYSFYCDVEHEVSPITAGCRCVLVYGLCWSGEESVHLRATSPFAASAEEKMVALLRRCAGLDCEETGTSDVRVLKDSESPLPKFCWALSGRYSLMDLHPRGMRGKDRVLIRLLQAANARLPGYARFRFRQNRHGALEWRIVLPNRGSQHVGRSVFFKLQPGCRQHS
ncbi:unnamed protein product [Amoebophrya sp. A120]|nr:unnamed protein product [Amoebophrya sp. A120]|eukprot:GSA120T00001558001.1